MKILHFENMMMYVYMCNSSLLPMRNNKLLIYITMYAHHVCIPCTLEGNNIKQVIRFHSNEGKSYDGNMHIWNNNTNAYVVFRFRVIYVV